MDYERINKVQIGVISPSKLRIKLLGSSYARRKEGGSKSSKASPSKTEEKKNAKSSLLVSDINNGDEGNVGILKLSEDVCAASFSMQKSVKEYMLDAQGDKNSLYPKDLVKKKGGSDHANFHYNYKLTSQQVQMGNLSIVHPMRPMEEDSSDLDNKQNRDSSLSFEFYRGARTLPSPSIGPISRPLPSKWNDAEKWIISRRTKNSDLLKKSALQSQANSLVLGSWVRATSESAISSLHHAIVAEKIDLHPPSSNVVEKFSFAPVGPLPSSEATNRQYQLDLPLDNGNCMIHLNRQGNGAEFPIAEQSPAKETGAPSTMPVCMRDMGTEMTPVTSQEPSRIGTPIGAATPIWSRDSSMASTPRRVPRSSPAKSPKNDGTSGLSEEEFQLKTRREIIALGIQLGKMNITAWARRDHVENSSAIHDTLGVDQSKKLTFEDRAAAWEEAEKSKQKASFKRDEIKIQAWESHQKARFKAKLREVEVQTERMRAHAQEKILKKIATLKQQSEAKLAAAEARKNKQATKTAKNVEIIRRSGHMHSSYFFCCSCFS